MSTPAFGHVRSPRPAPPGLGRAGQAQLVTVLLGFGLIAGFFITMFGRGLTEATAVVLGTCLFLATLMVLEIGLVVVILGMLLSPEIALGHFGVRDVAMRLQDVMAPILLLAWMGRKTLGIDRRVIRMDWTFLAMLAFLVVQLLATYIGWTIGRVESIAAGFYILKQAEMFAMCAFVAQYVHTVKRARAFIIVAVITSMVVAVYGLAKIPGNEVWTRNRVTAPFDGAPEPSTVGGYFVLTIGLITALAIKAPERRTRLRLLAIAGLLFVPFLYTLSRTSYVAFLVMVFTLAVLTRSRPLMAALVLGLLVSPFVLPHSVVDRIMYTFNDHTKVFGVFDRSFGERLVIWKRVAWTLRGSPLLGGGVSFRNVIDSYYARVLIESGTIGLMTFGLIIARLFVVSIRLQRRHEDWLARAFAIGYTAILVGLLVHGLSAITFVIVRIAEPFWGATGTLLGLYLSMDDSSAVQSVAPAKPAAAPTPEPVPALSMRRKWSSG